MCPMHVTRKFCICLFGIGQANNKVYFNFPYALAPCFYDHFGDFRKGAVRFGQDSNVPGTLSPGGYHLILPTLHPSF